MQNEAHDTLGGLDLSFTVLSADVLVVRSPIEVPVRTSFGVMNDRPAVYLMLTDAHGDIGLGEVWCNFPGCGAEHRAMLLQSAILPALLGRAFTDPSSCFEALQPQFQRLAIQSGEPGPIAQCLAGIDIALWDLVAKRHKTPLYRLLGGTGQRIGVYASGINPSGAVEQVSSCRDAGHRAFKLKIGFGCETDLANVEEISRQLEPGDEFMVDANQAWDLREALEFTPRLSDFPLKWLEEPMMATSPVQAFRELAAHCAVPLAGGENNAGTEEFDQAISGDWLQVMQPDMAKWGGFSGVLPVAEKILAAGKRFCPHCLGGGVGLAASAHILAAAGGDGLLEIDSNPNPLRALLFDPEVHEGGIVLSERPGLGIEPGQIEALKTHPAVVWQD